MNFQLEIGKLSKIIEIENSINSNQIATGISTDTRTINRGDLFIALVGERFDGHNFGAKAVEGGAIALVTNHQITENIPTKIPQIIVKDTLTAYQQIAHWWRQQLEITIVAVTGSVGKTTTKEMIGAVLSLWGKVLKTEANYNNEIGVPKTLLNIRDEDYAVVEMAMRGRGEIALLSQIAAPDIGVITNVGTAHIGRLGSKEAIAAAKCELLQHMNADGVAILNADDSLLMQTAAEVWQGKSLTYGLERGDIRGELVGTDTLQVDGLKLKLPLPGRHQALNYLAAIAVAQVLGLDLSRLEGGVEVNLPGGRGRRYHLDSDIVILDETYNAGVESMLAALELLQQTPGSRKIAVLGTMKELGPFSEALHQQVGEKVKSLGIDRLFVLVDEPATRAILRGAEGIPSESFTTHQQLVNRLQETVRKGDRLLFKASNSVGLSGVVRAVVSELKSE